MMDLPTECPVCGAYSMTHDQQSSTLLAVCDVLVVKALETMGKWLLRGDRSRFRTLGDHPRHEAHTLWQVEDELVDKALHGAWDVVPVLMGAYGVGDLRPDDLTAMLDRYVHDLVITGTSHSVGELQYRFRSELGLPVYLREVSDAQSV